jgi:Carboxypeptidase regulatory-like domain
MKLYSCLLALVTASMISFQTAAQSTTANISGIVTDGSGAAVPGAIITATNVLTSFTRSTTTDDTGAYLLTNLPIGQYSVMAEKDGFRKYTQTGITLTVEQNARVDVALSVGSVTESVNVSAQVADVDTRSAVIGEVVDRTRIQELPLNGRNAMELAKVVPGIISVSAPPVVTNARSGPAIVAAGGRDTSNEFRFDGISHKNLTQNTALNLPSPDALQEFRVQTSNFSSEYGRYSGAVVVAVTRSGTNDFHGSAWEYLRNKALNARNFFSTDKPDLKQNQFGFTFGGPAIRDRTFFFGSYQGMRIRETALFATAMPPTESERQGKFSGSARKPIDPVTGNRFPNDQIPLSRFDPVAVRLLERYVPLPNSPNGRWVSLVSSPTNGDQYLARVDHSFSSRNTANLRYFRDSTEQFFQSGNISPYAPNRRALTVTNWALQDTHAFSQSLLNELRLGVNRVDSKVFVLEDTQLSDLGANFPGVITPQLPTIGVTGYFTLGTSDVFGEDGSIYQIGDTLRWVRGRHSLSLGGEFEITHMFNRGSSANQGVFSFDGSATGNAFADFLLGKPISLDQASPYERLVRGYDWYAFVQDDIRVSRKLTVNLGLRYQLFRPYHNMFDRANTFHAGRQSTVVSGAPPGLVFPGDAGVSSGLVKADRNNFAPRIGLAWDALGNGRLSIRAAYGLYYEDHRSDLWTYPSVNQPFVIREFVNNPFSLQDPYRGRVNPFPYIYGASGAKFSFPMGLLTVIAPELPTPYVHQMSFSVEKALPSNMVVKAAYVGKLSHNLVRMIQKNPAVYRPGSSTADTDSRRPLMPGVYASVREIGPYSNAAYHSLQTSLTRRFSNGMTFMASYTLGKFLDEYSAQNLGQTPQDPYNWRGDRSRSDEDRRHVFNASFVYELPFFRTPKGLLPHVIGGWSLSGLISIASGEPVNVLAGRDASLTGVGFDRPNLVGDPVRSHSSRQDMIQNFFDTTAFVANQPGRYGTAGRNLFSGPASSITNLALTKNFRISERFGSIQFRSEFFNAFNQVNFGQPEARLNNRNFGRILTAGDPRIVQFALRYQF